MKTEFPKVKPLRLTARRLKRFRRLTGSTQAGVAFTLGMHPVTVSRIERGILTTKITGLPALTFRIAEKLAPALMAATVKP